MVAVPAPADLRRILDDDGKPLPGARAPSIAEATLLRMFETMLLVRAIDDQMTGLHRDGRVGFYMRATGEEATHFAAAALRDTDWILPSYREHGAWFWRGYTIQQYVDQLFGNAGDPAKGRQVPVHHSAAPLRLVSISSPVGTQIPQAVGAAYAARVLGKDDVALAFFGDGAASSGEFHVGLNFAGVWKAPCVFVCRRAGDTPGGRAFAAKAAGYGVHGVRVDGNDVLAVWQVATEAIDRARGGLGPTLIEAQITRVTDRDGTGAADPLRRLRGYLRQRGLWSEPREHEIVSRYHRDIDAAVAAASAKRAPELDTLFDDVYEHVPWHLREQRSYLAQQLRTKDPHRG
jgi:2-oxoisovalerate dehydrogenase E1 component alpha subunit